MEIRHYILYPPNICGTSIKLNTLCEFISLFKYFPIKILKALILLILFQYIVSSILFPFSYSYVSLNKSKEIWAEETKLFSVHRSERNMCDFHRTKYLHFQSKRQIKHPKWLLSNSSGNEASLPILLFLTIPRRFG